MATDKRVLGLVPTLFCIAIVILSGFRVYSADKTDNEDTRGKRFVSIRLEDEKKNTAVDYGGLTDIFANDLPLSAVLEYLTQKSGFNITPAKESVGAIKITVRLQQVHWRDVLEFIANKYKLTVDYSRETRGIIIVDKPQQITYNFTKSNVRDVINIIARQADANIIMDDGISGTITMRLRDIPWRTALELVVKTAPQDLAIVEDTQNNILRIVQAAKIKDELETRIFRLSYVQPLGSNYIGKISEPKFLAAQSGESLGDQGRSLMDVLKLVATDGVGKIAFDKRSNALIIRDTPVQLDAMQKIIEELDIAPKQIHIAIQLVQLSGDDSRNLGIRWEAGIGDGTGAGFGLTQTFPTAVPTGFPFMFGGGEKLSDSILSDFYLVGINRDPATDPNNTSFEDAQTVRASGARAMAGVTGVTTPIEVGRLSFNNSRLVLEMIRRKTTGSIIQTPSLITLDHEEATMHVGDLIRYAEQSTTTTEGGGTSSGFQEARNSPLTTGVQVLMIPHVTGTDNNILMTVIPKLEEVTSMPTFSGPDGTTLVLPETSSTIMVTKMLMRNRETAVMGGLKRVVKSKEDFVVPYLGELPVIGWLFRGTNTTEDTKTVYVFVTPTIIDFNDRKRFDRELSRIRDEFSKPFVTQEKITK